MKFLVAMIIVAISFSGCTEVGCNPLSASSQSSDAHIDGSELSFRSQFAGQSIVHEKTWSFAGDQAKVVWEGDISSGRVAIQLFDGCGNEVYHSGLEPGVGGVTQLSDGGGEAGTWLMRATLENVEGQVWFTVSKA